jgi:hypothetical protein
MHAVVQAQSLVDINMTTVEGAAKVQKTNARQSPKGMAAVPKPPAELPHHRANVIVQFRSHDGELTGDPRPRAPYN